MAFKNVALVTAGELFASFAYFGMRALLVLYLIASPNEGGLGLDDRTALAIYGLFVASVYLAALPGGWIADRVLGAVPAIWLGGLLIVAGNAMLAVPAHRLPFAAGLAAIVAGVGLLKPNITALVAEAAREGTLRPDSTFTIFYVGINVGGSLGPLLSSAVAGRYGWRCGFIVSALGMLIGLAAFSKVTTRLIRGSKNETAPIAWWVLVAFAAAGITMLFAPARQLVRFAFAMVLLAAIGGFWVLFRGSHSRIERSNVGALLGLFCGASLFWAADEQAGASLTLLAQRFTNRSMLGVSFPAAWYQSVFPLYVILLAPLFVYLWQTLAKRRLEPSATLKFGMGLALGGAGLAVARWSLAGAPLAGASPGWLALTYLLIAIGEILVAPGGLAAVTRLSPVGRRGLATGLWYLSLSLGGLIAGMTGGMYDLSTRSGLSATFSSVAILLAAASAAFLIVTAYRAWVRRSA
jgi:proton-dependent oligopeptide transporter, POT family